MKRWRIVNNGKPVSHVYADEARAREDCDQMNIAGQFLLGLQEFEVEEVELQPWDGESLLKAKED